MIHVVCCYVLILFSNKRSLFHLNSWLWLACSGVRAAAADLVGLGQNRVFRVVAKEPGSVLLQLVEKKGTTCGYVCSLAGSSRALCVPSVLCLGNRISVVPEYRSLWFCGCVVGV